MTRNHRLLIAIGLAAAGAALPVTGLLSASASPGNLPDIPAAPAPLTAGTLHSMPLASYVLSPEQAAILQNAAIIKARACAARFDVAITLPANNRRLSSDATLFDGRYALLTIQRATRVGYSQPDPAGFTKVDDIARGSWNPTPREAAVLGDGGGAIALHDKQGRPVPRGGCIADAYRALEGGTDHGQALRQRLTDGLNMAATAVADDPRMAATTKAWSTCMASSGHRFANPQDAQGATFRKPLAEQIPVAVADATCAARTNYWGINHALDVAYQQRFVAQHRDALDDDRREVIKALENARVIVSTAHQH